MKTTTICGDTKEILFEDKYLKKRPANGLIEREINVENKYLSCQLKEICIKDICMQFGNVTIDQDVIVNTNYSNPTLTIYFNLEGTLMFTDIKTSNDISVSEGEFCLIYNQPDDVNISIRKNQSVRYLYINIRAEDFLEYIESQFLDTDSMLNFGLKLQNKVKGLISDYMFEVINKIICNQSKGMVRAILITSKVMELFGLQLEEVDSLKNNAGKNMAASADMTKIYHARELLISRISNPPTIKELAKLVSINEYKLKKGFREVFNNSVHGMLYDQRMQLAMKMLQDSSFSISDIAERVGYNYSHHFSKAFKKKYNLLPRDVRG